MIKIHSLLPNKSIHKEVSVQTDGLLPKIIISHKNNNICNQVIKHHGLHAYGQNNKNSKQSHYFHQRRQEGSRNNLDLQNQAVKFRRDRKQNTRFSLQSSKIQAKLFKFLKFQQNVLKLAIVKYLEGKQLSKDEKKKIDQIIKLSFISTPIKQHHHYQQSQYDQQEVIVEIPIHQQFSITIKEIINAIRQIYTKINPKKDHALAYNTINKKIAQISQSLIYQISNSKIHEPLIVHWKRQEIIYSYLQRYVKQCQAKLGHQDLKQRLITFYQDTYKKYENVPFNQQERQQISQIIINSNTPQHQNHRSNNTCINGQSYIKLKFCNDLRKQIKKLGEDTEKIIIDQMNKLNQE